MDGFEDHEAEQVVEGVNMTGRSGGTDTENLKKLQKKLGYRFSNDELLKRALTRRAYAKEQRDRKELCKDQDAYRVLGDAVLGAVVIDQLVTKEKLETRGEITDRRKELENKYNLRDIALKKEIWSHIRTNRGEEKSGAGEQPYVLAETLEALIGAIHLDNGRDFKETKRIVARWLNI